jgi:putrescine transport system permease protein
MADTTIAAPAAPAPAAATFRSDWTKWLPVAIPYFWSTLFFLLPFFIVLRISFSNSEIAQPPYTPVFDFFNDGISGTFAHLSEFTTASYGRLISDSDGNFTLLSIYTRSYLSSVWIAFISTIFTLIIGYPIAYAMARAPNQWRPTLLMLIILPFWTSFLIRIYAWMGILANEGFLNNALIGMGIIKEPLVIMQTNWAVYIGIIYSYLPFMILPLYSALEKMDLTLLEAAEDLGSPPLKSFWTITFPLSMPGVIAGCFLVFIPVVGEFVIPDLLGGSSTLIIGHTLWEEFGPNHDWPTASALAIILLLVLVIPIVLFQNHQAKTTGSVR